MPSKNAFPFPCKCALSGKYLIPVFFFLFSFPPSLFCPFFWIYISSCSLPAIPRIEKTLVGKGHPQTSPLAESPDLITEEKAAVSAVAANSGAADPKTMPYILSNHSERSGSSGSNSGAIAEERRSGSSSASAAALIKSPPSAKSPATKSLSMKSPSTQSAASAVTRSPGVKSKNSSTFSVFSPKNSARVSPDMQ